MLVAIAAIAVIFGILYVAVAYGFWIGAAWSRWLAIILSTLGIILGIISLLGGSIASIVIIIVYGLVLWYMMQPSVKSFFGAAPPPTPPPKPPA